jgi:hypothetical protein
VSELEKLTEKMTNKYVCRSERQEITCPLIQTGNLVSSKKKNQKKEASCWNAFAEISNRSYTPRSKEE